MQKRNYRILLVEDDADDRYIMQQAFTELGASDDVRMFCSGDELLQHLKSLPETALPDLFVLDYNMPAINGAELALYLKARAPWNKIPVVLYSTGMSPKMKQELLAGGVLRCYEKGMEYSEVLDLTRSMVKLLPDENPEITSPNTEWHSV